VSKIILPRRTVITGLAALLATPAIVRAESLMRLPQKPKIIRPPVGRLAWGLLGVGQFADGPTLDGFPIVMGDGSPLRTGDVPAGEFLAAAFNGAAWVMLS
jgi:hypothetical protein